MVNRMWLDSYLLQPIQFNTCICYVKPQKLNHGSIKILLRISSDIFRKGDIFYRDKIYYGSKKNTGPTGRYLTKNFPRLL
jgi:hypothetical protein